MTKRDRLSGIRIIAMTLLSLFTYVIYIVSRMFGGILRIWYMQLIPGLQCLTLLICPWGPEKL